MLETTMFCFVPSQKDN